MIRPELTVLADEEVTSFAGGASDSQGSQGNALSSTFEADHGEVLSSMVTHKGTTSSGTA